MTSVKYIGLDVHKESISICVRNSVGKVVMESVIETKASTVLQFIDVLRGDLRVTFEEGTWAAWLYDLLKPRVSGVEVCNPRKNALLKDGSKSDRIDANKLSEQLYMNNIKSVYHGEHGLRTLKELARSYLTISKDLTRVMNRLKALYRSWAIPCTGKEVCAPRHRAEWLGKISEPGVRRRAEFYYQQLDALRLLRQEVRRDLLLEVKKHKAWKLLRQIPGIGPIRAAVLMAVMQTPHRFRTKRQLWNYCGLGLETRPRWFIPRLPCLQRRRGGRMALFSQVLTPDRSVATYNLHFESRGSDDLRYSQLYELLEDLKRCSPDVPVIAAGDFNFDLSQGQPAAALADVRFVNPFATLRQATTVTHSLSARDRVIDCILLRGPLIGTDAHVHSSVLASDHFPLSLTVSFC